MSAAGVAGALARAHAFLRARADELSRRRASALLAGGGADEVVAWLAARQAPDGSFSPGGGQGRGGGVAGTLEGLAILADLRALAAPTVEPATAYLSGAQRPDGSWACTGAVGEPARRVLTGLLGGYLARTACADERVLERAGEFLAADWSPARLESGDFATLAAYAHFFSNAPHELADEILQWCGRELERGFRSMRLGPLGAARILTLCDALALPGARVDAGELLPGLVGEQGEDGGYGFSPGAPPSVSATLEGALALVRFSRG